MENPYLYAIWTPYNSRKAFEYLNSTFRVSDIGQLNLVLDRTSIQLVSFTPNIREHPVNGTSVTAQEAKQSLEGRMRDAKINFAEVHLNSLLSQIRGS